MPFLSNHFSYCGHKPFFYQNSELKDTFYKLNEYSTIEYVQRYVYKFIFNFLNLNKDSFFNKGKYQEK